MYNTEYVLEMEHIVKQSDFVVDACLSYVKALGPKNKEKAISYFKSTRNSSYINIHGVENSVTVHDIYKKITKEE